MLFLSAVVNAKQFAMCYPDVTLNPTFCYCFKQTSTGKQIELKARSAGEMYSNGWRLITVSSYENQSRTEVHGYFYFEKEQLTKAIFLVSTSLVLILNK